MSANAQTDQEQTAVEGKRLLRQLHDQRLIDLDAPGDVSGHQLTSTTIDGPAPDQWWVFVDADNDGQGRRSGRVLAGSDLKDAGMRK